MGTYTLESSPSFAKDGINFTIDDISDYAIAELTYQGTTYYLKHPAINGEAKFNLAKLVEKDYSEEFNLSGDLIQEINNIYAEWELEVYNIDGEVLTSPRFSGSGFNFSGSGKNFEALNIMNQFRQRRIGRTDFVLLYYYAIPGTEYTVNIIFDDAAETIVTQTKTVNSRVMQILILPENIPADATQMNIEIVGSPESFIIYIDDINEIDKQIFVYRNQMGVYDSFTMLGHTQLIENYSAGIIETLEGSKKYNIEVQESVEKSGYLLWAQHQDEEAASEMLREIFMSEEIYLVEDGENIPIIIKDKKRVVKNTMNQEYVFEISYIKNKENA